MKRVQAFVSGFSAYFKVIPLFSKLGLWKYLMLTAVISLAVVFFIGFLAYGVAKGVLAVPVQHIIGGSYPGFATAAAIVAFVGIAALGALLFKHLVLIATAPWMGKVAEKVRTHLTGTTIEVESLAKTKEHRWKLINRSLRLNARLIAFEMLLTIPLLLLGLIPGVNLVALVLLVIVQSYFVGAGTLDFSLEEHYDYGESVAYVNNNRWLTIGVGLGFVLLLFTAIGFLFAPAWSAAAGAYAFNKRVAA